MDETVAPKPGVEPRPVRDLDSWRGDIRDRPPKWRRRPRKARAREL